MTFEAQKRYFEQRFSEHDGDPVLAVWKSLEVAQRNNASIAQAFTHESGPFEVLEIGSGTGLLYEYLLEHVPNARYSGVDISNRMVEAMRRRCPNARVEVRDILESPPARKFDYVVASGVFNLRLQQAPASWWITVQRLMTAMFALANKGIAVNFLTGWTDWRREWGYYQDPSEVLHFAQSKLSRFAEMHHEYYPWEFALYVYKNPKPLPNGPPVVQWPPDTRERPDRSEF